MTSCPSCAAAVSANARFCSSCGQEISSFSRSPTGLATPEALQKALRRSPSSVPVGRLASSESIDSGGFTPGTVLTERYRIIGLLGRGGMGEVSLLVVLAFAGLASWSFHSSLGGRPVFRGAALEEA